MNHDINYEELEELKIPTQEEAKEMVDQHFGEDGAVYLIQPLSYDLKLADKKGITKSSQFDEQYLYLQALYRTVLEQHFTEKLALTDYDEQLQNHELRFLPEEEYNFYQKYSTMDLQFLYLRSNCPIERLSEEDLSLLNDSLETYPEISEELRNMVIRTYPDILKAYESRDNDIPMGFSNDGQKIARNASVVFELAHAKEFDENGNYVSRENERRKREYVEETLLPEIQEVFTEQLGYPVVVFVK